MKDKDTNFFVELCPSNWSATFLLVLVMFILTGFAQQLSDHFGSPQIELSIDLEKIVDPENKNPGENAEVDDYVQTIDMHLFHLEAAGTLPFEKTTSSFNTYLKAPNPPPRLA